MQGNDSIALVEHWRHGDEAAAAALFGRYAAQLTALARRRLSDRLAARIDPEDVVQSVYRSFFCAAREGRYDIKHGGDLWRLLVAITLHKLDHQIRRATAAKRSIARERDGALPLAVLARNPSPLEAVILADELEQFLRGLEATPRQIVELRLQGYNHEEIARKTERCERTVRRVLDVVKERLAQADFLGPHG